jgi:hypothetical protein
MYKENHGVQKNMRKGTQFERSKLTLGEVILLTCFWVQNFLQLNADMGFHMSSASVQRARQMALDTMWKQMNQSSGIFNQRGINFKRRV